MSVALLNVPVGTIIDFAGTSTPEGYLECDGHAVGRSAFAALFDAIGTLWGAGDGSTTFNVPDLRGRCSIGAGTGTAGGATAHALASKGGDERMQKHNHAQRLADSGTEAGKAAYDWTITSTTRLYSGDDLAVFAGGGSSQNMQPFATVRKLIRAA